MFQSSGTEAELETLLHFMYLCSVGIAKTTRSGEVQMMNAKASQLLMPIAKRANLSNLFEVLESYAPELRNLVASFQRPHGKVCENHQVELPVARNRHRAIVLSITIIKIDMDSLMTVITDITKMVEQERMLKLREERLRAIFDGIRDYAIYTLDKEGRIDSWNQSVQRVEGYIASDIIGQPFGFDYVAESRSASTIALRLKQADKFGWHEDEGWRVRRDGSLFWANTIVSVLQDDESQGICGYSVITRDITERKKADDALRSMALTDFLTGIFNRRCFFEQADREAALATETGCPLSFLLIDADHFKRINHSYGHSVGDAVLKEMTAACMRCVRPGDLLARYDGEEFVIMLRQTPLKEALALAESIRQMITKCAVLSADDLVKFTVSIGVAPFRGSLQVSLQQADQALYAAKQSGRNRVLSLDTA